MKNRFTEKGFELPTKEELLEEIIELARDNKIDIIPYSNDHIIANFIADWTYNIYLQMNKVRASFNVNEARDNSLNNLALLKSIDRLKAKPSKVTMELTFKDKNAAYDFTTNNPVRVSDGENFFISDEDFVITDNSGVKKVSFRSEKPGANKNVFANTLTEIDKDPSGAIASVTNPLSALFGRDAESDEELRERVKKTYPSVLSVTRLEQELNKIANIKYAKVFFNYSDESINEESTTGVPFNQTAVIIDDNVEEKSSIEEGVKKEIWEAILHNTSPNIKWYKPDNAIEIGGKFNGNPISFYVVKPTNEPLKFKIDAREISERNKKNLLENIYTEINRFLLDKRTGELISNFEISKYLQERLTFLKGFSLFNIFIKKASDITDWGDDFSVQLLFNKIAIIDMDNIELYYNEKLIKVKQKEQAEAETEAEQAAAAEEEESNE